MTDPCKRCTDIFGEGKEKLFVFFFLSILSPLLLLLPVVLMNVLNRLCVLSGSFDHSCRRDGVTDPDSSDQEKQTNTKHEKNTRHLVPTKTAIHQITL